MLKPKITLLAFFLAILFVASRPIAFAQQPAPSIPFDDCPESVFGCFEVGLPGIPTDQSIDQFVGEAEQEPLLKFVNLAVNTVIAVLVVIGLIIIVAGGYIYMTAAGDGSRVKLAKEMIFAALFGIVLSFVSVVILNTINRYIGSDAQEPVLGEPGSGSNTGGNSGGEGNNGGNGPSNNNGNGGNNNGGGNGGGNNLPSNQARFDTTPPPSTPETVTIIIDDTNYYIRDANGFDQLTDVNGAVEAARNAQGGIDNLKARIYQAPSARNSAESTLRTALSGANISGLQVNWSDVPIGYKQ